MRQILTTLAVIIGANPLFAEVWTIDWPDLIDQRVQSYEDPFVDLSHEQMDNLRRIVRLQAELDGGQVSPEKSAKLQEIKAALFEQGIDADWLISQRWVVAGRREWAGVAGNPVLDGETVTLGGSSPSRRRLPRTVPLQLTSCPNAALAAMSHRPHRTR